MPTPSPQDESSIRPPHPLAARLVERLRERPESRILDFGAGSGRNSAALRRAGYDVVTVDDGAAAASSDPLPAMLGRFDAAVSTHGLLHGTTNAIAGRVSALAALLDPNAPLFAVFGSTRDARFGKGTRIEASVFAPVDGDERGVAHAYFARSSLQAMLEAYFTIELLEERDADETAGSWAHRAQPLSGAVHWFVIARRRPPSGS